MRTMYIYLSWIGWGWAVIAIPAVAGLIHWRQRRQNQPGGSPVVPSPARVESSAVEVERRP